MGEDVDVNVIFLEDYYVKDLVGKDVFFKVKIYEVKEK